MSVRGDKARFAPVRGDSQSKGSVLGQEIKGSEANATVRDIASALSISGQSVTQENVVRVVGSLVDAINGPVARAIFEAGRFIDDRGKYRGP